MSFSCLADAGLDRLSALGLAWFTLTMVRSRSGASNEQGVWNEHARTHENLYDSSPAVCWALKTWALLRIFALSTWHSECLDAPLCSHETVRGREASKRIEGTHRQTLRACRLRESDVGWQETIRR
jgi:hypothetical protein